MSRSLAREVAMKMLYANSSGGGETVPEILEQSGEQDTFCDEDRTFLENEIAGVEEHKEELDEIISKYLRGWTVDRLARVDGILLRMAVYEMKYMPEVPVGASINEAVELAKRFAEGKSSRFINGVLGSAAKELRPE